MRKVRNLINRYSDSPLRFNVTLDGFFHSFRFAAGNPDFTTLAADSNGNLLKEIEMVIHQPIDSGFLISNFASANSAQSIFHGLFSLLVLGSSHFAGSNQWTVMI